MRHLFCVENIEIHSILDFYSTLCKGNERYIPLEDNLTIFKGDSSFDEKCFKGKLYFTLVGVKDLDKSDYIGKSDPYALIYYKEEVFKSETISNNLNPVWNLAITIDIILLKMMS